MLSGALELSVKGLIMTVLAWVIILGALSSQGLANNPATKYRASGSSIAVKKKKKTITHMDINPMHTAANLAHDARETDSLLIVRVGEILDRQEERVMANDDKLLNLMTARLETLERRMNESIDNE